MAVVDQGQTLLDFIIQWCGTLDDAFALALLNDVSISDMVQPGTELQVPATVSRPDVVEHLAIEGIIPASNEPVQTVETALEGVGYWIIGYDFKVS